MEIIKEDIINNIVDEVVDVVVDEVFEELQNTFNKDSIESLLDEEGVVENVYN